MGTTQLTVGLSVLVCVVWFPMRARQHLTERSRNISQDKTHKMIIDTNRYQSHYDWTQTQTRTRIRTRTRNLDLARHHWTHQSLRLMSGDFRQMQQTNLQWHWGKNCLRSRLRCHQVRDLWGRRSWDNCKGIRTEMYLAQTGEPQVQI